MKRGTILLTKDGRKIGNAIVLSKKEKDDWVFYTVKTDFGNVVTFTKYELKELFYIEKKSRFKRYTEDPVTDWVMAKEGLFFKGL
jgi:hypothetical protein